MKSEKLLHSGPLKLLIGPAFDKYMEWGFFDGGVRFFTTDSKRVGNFSVPSNLADANCVQLVGLFEHVHVGQLSTALFADSKTLITAGLDCTVSVWTMLSTPKSVELQPRKTLFGHRTVITTLATSRSFSALLSASSDGQVILWDLNLLNLVRILTRGKPVEVQQNPFDISRHFKAYNEIVCSHQRRYRFNHAVSRIGIIPLDS